MPFGPGRFALVCDVLVSLLVGVASAVASVASATADVAALLHHLGQVVVGNAVVPVVAGNGPGEPGAGQALGEVVQVGLRDLDPEGADVLCHGRTVERQQE